MIFDIKQQDLRHKARFVVGGHMLDSSMYNTYLSTIQGILIRLLFLIAMDNKLDIVTGDVGNAFPTAPCAEKVLTMAGPKFGRNKGSFIEIIHALYGLTTASRSFHEFLGDTLRRMRSNPSRADQDLWWRKSDNYEGYNYVATHEDDIITVAKNPS